MASAVPNESGAGIDPQRVLHVSTAHWPYDHRIFRKEILSLVKSGCQVAFAATVEQPQVVSGVEFIPLGKYGASRWERIPRNLRALVAMMRNPAHVIHIHDPELLVTVIPALLAGKRVIYDIHEFYFENISEADWIWAGVRPLAAKLYSILECLLLPHFAGLVVVTEGMEEMYRRRLPGANISLVRNYPAIDDEACSLALSQKAPISAPYIVHTGGARRNKAFDVMVAVAERLRERGLGAPIINIGPVDLSAFPSKERDRALQRAKAADVRLLGALDYPEVLWWVAHARIGCVLYPDSANYRAAQSTKLFEYMALGVSIVATSVGHMGEIVREHGAGLVVAPGDVAAYASALERLLTDDDLARRTAQASREAGKRFTFNTEVAALLDVYGRSIGK